MKRTKRFFALALSFCMVLALMTACGSDSSGDTGTGGSGAESSGDEQYTFQVGHVVTTDHSYHLGLQRFGELLSEKSDGRISLEIFPSSQLGNESDLTEGVVMGTVDMALINSGNLASFTDSYSLFDLPFLFRDEEHARSVITGEIGQECLDSLTDLGIKGLANWEAGFFCIWNNKRPIETPDDVVGLKIRANNNPIHIASYEALGVAPVTMGWSEVYTAIQNGTVDGVSVAITSMYTANIQEVAPYISTSGEFYVTAPLIMNADLFNSLPADIQTIITEAANEATAYQIETNGEMVEQFIQNLKDEGYQVTEPDKEAFKAVCWDTVYDQFVDQIGADRIETVQNDY